MTLRTLLYVAAVVSLLCYVKGGDNGGHNTYTGYGSRYGGRSVRPISVIYPSLYQTQWSSLPYQYPTSYYSPPVSNPSYPQYYPSYYHSHHTHNLDPFLFSTPSSGFGGGIFNSGWIPLIVMFFLLAFFAPWLISSLTMSNDILY